MTDVRQRIRAYWDRDAVSYDRKPSHAASHPEEASAWRAVLARHLPPPPSRVLDVGAGTGSMSLLAAELGHRVTALDISPAMLERAGAKARARNLDLELVVGSSEEPPGGPFDAVMERHVLWTTPDPPAGLRAWRTVAPGGRLLLLEGVWGRDDLAERARRLVGRIARWVLRIPPDHHAPYPEDVLETLPWARLDSPAPLIGAVAEAGWRRIRVERLRAVERARRRAGPWPLGWLEQVPRYAITAEA